MDDAEIVNRVLDGHVNDFAVLLQRHGPYLQRIVSGMVPTAEAPELVQEVFVKAYDGLDGFNTGKKFRNWLAGIAIRTSQEYWRQHYNRRELPESALSGQHLQSIELLAAGQALEVQQREAAQQDAREVLHLALGHLSETDRTVLTLVYLEEFSLKEAAAVLGCTLLTAKVRAHRARKALRTILATLAEKQP